MTIDRLDQNVQNPWEGEEEIKIIGCLEDIDLYDIGAQDLVPAIKRAGSEYLIEIYDDEFFVLASEKIHEYAYESMLRFCKLFIKNSERI